MVDYNPKKCHLITLCIMCKRKRAKTDRAPFISPHHEVPPHTKSNSNSETFPPRSCNNGSFHCRQHSRGAGLAPGHSDALLSPTRAQVGLYESVLSNCYRPLASVGYNPRRLELIIGSTLEGVLCAVSPTRVQDRFQEVTQQQLLYGLSQNIDNSA